MKTVGLFALTSLPYSFKFLWAPFFDLYAAPFIKRGRSGWMILCQVGLISSLVGLSMLDPKTEIGLVAALTFLTSLFAASQDIAVDGWRVHVLEDDEQGVGATAATFGFRFGMYLSSAGAILMSVMMSWSNIYRSMSIIFALGMFIALYAAHLRRPSEPHAHRHEHSSPRWLTLIVVFFLALPLLISIAPVALIDAGSSAGQLDVMKALKSQLKTVATVLIFLIMIALGFAGLKRSQNRTQKRQGVIAQARVRWGSQWLVILLFICVFRLGDHLLNIFLFPSLIELKFTELEIGTIAKTWGLAATFLGTFLGGWLVYRMGLMKVMVIAGVAQALSNLTLSAQALIGHSVPFLYVSIGIQDLALGMVNATFVAYISSLCDRRYAAAHFAFLSALPSLLKTFIQAGSGWIVVECKARYGLQGGWAVYYALTSLTALPGLALLWYLIRASKPEQSTSADLQNVE